MTAPDPASFYYFSEHQYSLNQLLYSGEDCRVMFTFTDGSHLFAYMPSPSSNTKWVYRARIYSPISRNYNGRRIDYTHIKPVSQKPHLYETNALILIDDPIEITVLVRENCQTALGVNGRLLGYLPVEERTEDLCKLALTNTPLALEFVPKEFRQRFAGNYYAVLWADPMALAWLDRDEQTVERCIDAFKLLKALFVNQGHQTVPTEAIRDILACVYTLTPEIYEYAVRCNGCILERFCDYRDNPTVCLAAVETTPDAIEWVAPEAQTPAVCLAAVRANGLLLEHIADSKQTREICEAAVRQAGARALTFVEEEFLTPDLLGLIA